MLGRTWSTPAESVCTTRTEVISDIGRCETAGGCI